MTFQRHDRALRFEPPAVLVKSRAQAVVEAYLEDVGSPTQKQEVVLQYRPALVGATGWVWFWVLLPKSRTRALATGQATSRAEASRMARIEARKLRVRVGSIEVLDSTKATEPTAVAP